jgi:hypothetical protein
MGGASRILTHNRVFVTIGLRDIGRAAFRRINDEVADMATVRFEIALEGDRMPAIDRAVDDIGLAGSLTFEGGADVARIDMKMPRYAVAALVLHVLAIGCARGGGRQEADDAHPLGGSNDPHGPYSMPTKSQPQGQFRLGHRHGPAHSAPTASARFTAS